MTNSIIDVKGDSNGAIQVNLENLGIATKRRHKSYTVYCPSLKVLGYSSKSERDAFKDFEKNLRIFFLVHLRRDSLSDALNIFNWEKDNTSDVFGSNNDSNALQTKNFSLSLGLAA